MSETCEGFGRFDKLQSAAYWTNKNFASNAIFDKEFMLDDYKNFLQEKMKNPVAGDIAMQKAKNNTPNADSTEYLKNKKMLERSPEIDSMVKTIEKQENQNYPKTKKLRKVLIKNDNFDLYGVMPKLSKSKKIILKLKSLI